MIKTIIVDDEIIAIKRMVRLLEKVEGISVCSTFDNPHDVIKYIKENSIDIAFLDIEMPGITGIALAEEIEAINPKTEVVFITAYDKYSLDAFDAGAVGYILKPIELEEIKKQISRHRNRHISSNNNYKLNIECFGGFTITNKSESSHIHFRTEKATQLFAYLVSRLGKPVSKYKLFSIFWENMNEKQASSNLYSTCYTIKKSLKEHGYENVLLKRNNMYYIDFNNINCDILEFIKIYETKKHLNKVSQIYKAEIFESCCYSWTSAIAIEYEQKYVELEILLLKEYARKNDRININRVLKRLVNNDICDESEYCEIINALNNKDSIGIDRILKDYGITE